MTYADYCYQILKSNEKSLEAMYEDYIIHLIGVAGLTELRGSHLLETCGIVLGRKMYVLCDK
jgi:hypothetical protein